MWTKQEVTYLEDNWGIESIKCIAIKLNRTINSIKIKARKIGLTDIRKATDLITVFQLSKCLHIHYGTIALNWIPNHGFPVKTRITTETKRYKYFDINEFWEWAEKHKNLVNFARLEEDVLGIEPMWVKEKRKFDILNMEKKLKKAWSKSEISILISLVRLQRYTYSEMSQRLGRSEAAIKRELYELKIMDRPVYTNKVFWRDEEVSKLIKLLNKGSGWNTIAQQLGRSALSCRAKYERLQKENIV